MLLACGETVSSPTIVCMFPDPTLFPDRVATWEDKLNANYVLERLEPFVSADDQDAKRLREIDISCVFTDKEKEKTWREQLRQHAKIVEWSTTIKIRFV